MSAEPYTHIEQDRDAPPGDDEPPSYDDLAAQNGPNSRFGRWRGWIEKRAAERYVDITPQERQRRKERGWQLRDGSEPSEEYSAPPDILYTQTPSANPFHTGAEGSLYIQTNNLSINDSASPPSPVSEVQLPFISQPIPPSHLKINHFGSRFLPHTTSQIRCVLPLLADRLVLIGHDEGLSVLDMFPQEWTENGDIIVKRPNEAQAHVIWRGETVHQMTILELEDTGEGTPQGVVLALVGPEPENGSSRDSDFHILRMYNLSSLTSLARWAVSQKGARPLDLYRPSNWQGLQQSPSRRHRPQGSIARSIKSFIDSPAAAHQVEQPTSYHSLMTATSSIGPSFARAPSVLERPNSPPRGDSTDSTWDVVDELPLRWATDFVALASPGSRLSSTSVLSYTTWYDRNRRSTGGQYLAIATKNSILLYETPRGERAYRFVKDFYTPLQPRSICFFHQFVQDNGKMSSESPRHRRDASGACTISPVNGDGTANSGGTINYGVHLCLFVVFDKKASWIRIADSAVGEFEFQDDAGPASQSVSYRDTLSPASNSITSRTRSRLSFEIRESVAKWILPAQCELPVHDPRTNSIKQKTVIFLTKGNRTHLMICPLPMKLSSVPPLHVIYWKKAPKQISARICQPSRDSLAAPPRGGPQLPFLQVIAFGEGLEIYEISLAVLYEGANGGNGKGKSKVLNTLPSVRADEDLGDVGYLQSGGNWDQADELYSGGLERMDSYASSIASFNTVESDDFLRLLKREAGMYGWCRKGVEDYRIFWLGGTYDERTGPRGDGDSLYS